MQIQAFPDAADRAPSPLMLCSGPVRAAAELMATASLAPWATLAPAGDGHPVLVLPGHWSLLEAVVLPTLERLDGMSDWHPCVTGADPARESIGVASSHPGLADADAG